MSKLREAIFYLFAILFFLTPLVFYIRTSEVFEFNKIVIVYFLTTLILSAWILRMIFEKRIIFNRTLLDIPLLIFLGSQLLSTIFSIDITTSIFGYYSRFNGGLLSLLSYSILYWAYVSNLKREDSKKHILVLILASTISALLAIGEHFGIFLTCGFIGSVTVNCWQQDVQTRVFSTFGQPNWLAAWIAAISPISWFSAEKEDIKNFKFWIWTIISIIFYTTLLFTRSRSGLVGYFAALIFFWAFYFWQSSRLSDPGSVKMRFMTIYKSLLIAGFPVLILSLMFGTPWTPKISELISNKIKNTNEVITGPALETGGTESGIIRKIVWQGALQVFLHYPIIGSGVETFAYSYYQYRPKEHNLVSEWDYVYNKAHNEYLNYAATTGLIGFVSYLALIVFSLIQLSKPEFLIFRQILSLKFENLKNYLNQLETANLSLALLAGYLSILISNFFGFSVVPIEIQFFIYPALAIVPSAQFTATTKEKRSVNKKEKILISLIIYIMFYLLTQIATYWYADLLYSKAKNYNSLGKPNQAIPLLIKAIKLEPYQAIYFNEASLAFSLAAQEAYDQKDLTKTNENIDNALFYSQKASDLSSANLNIKKSRFGLFLKLSSINPQFLILARDTLKDAITFAPTDAKLYYNFGLTQARVGQTDEAIKTFEKTIELKANYKEARLAYALLLIDKKEFQKAKEQLTYILEKIDPNDSLAKQTLQKIK